MLERCRIEGSARVSTYGRTLDAQFEHLKVAGCAKIYREKATGARTAAQIAGSKKEVMVADAEQLLAETGWLPSILRLLEAANSMESSGIDSLTIPQMPVAAEQPFFR